jgi:hypothetical protein
MNVGLVLVQIKDHDPGLQREYHMFTMPPRLGSRTLLGAEATRGGCTLDGVASTSPQEVAGYSSTIERSVVARLRRDQLPTFGAEFNLLGRNRTPTIHLRIWTPSV